MSKNFPYIFLSEMLKLLISFTGRYNSLFPIFFTIINNIMTMIILSSITAFHKFHIIIVTLFIEDNKFDDVKYRFSFLLSIVKLLTAIDLPLRQYISC